MPNCAKARLKPIRWPSRSVSTSTPSQSKISALIIPPAPSRRLGEERGRAVLAAELLDEAAEQRLAGLVLGIDHSQRLVIAGLVLCVLDEAVDEYGWPGGADAAEAKDELIRKLHKLKTEITAGLVAEGGLPLRLIDAQYQACKDLFAGFIEKFGGKDRAQPYLAKAA